VALLDQGETQEIGEQRTSRLAEEYLRVWIDPLGDCLDQAARRFFINTLRVIRPRRRPVFADVRDGGVDQRSVAGDRNCLTPALSIRYYGRGHGVKTPYTGTMISRVRGASLT